MVRHGMVIDLKRCNGNGACTIACKAEQSTPSGTSYALVKEIEIGTYPKAQRLFLPYICMHCEDPPCMQACPTRAIRKRPDGVVYVDEDRCATMRACLMACPYGAITSNPRAKGSISYYPGTLTLYEAWGYGRHSPGAALKCNFCLHRVEKGLLPACVQTCPTDARIFGDLDDPTSKVARLIRERPHMRLLEEKGTNPSVYYVF